MHENAESYELDLNWWRLVQRRKHSMQLYKVRILGAK